MKDVLLWESLLLHITNLLLSSFIHLFLFFTDKKEKWKPMEDINIPLKRSGKNSRGAKSDSKNWREDSAGAKKGLSFFINCEFGVNKVHFFSPSYVNLIYGSLDNSLYTFHILNTCSKNSSTAVELMMNF